MKRIAFTSLATQPITRAQYIVCAALLLCWAAAASDAIAAPVTLNGITHQYSLNESSGTTTADSIGSINASLSAFNPGNAQWVPGVFGNGIQFNNENALVLTDLPLSSGAANQFSVSFWARVDSFPNDKDSVTVTPKLDNWVTYNPTGNTNGSGKQGIGIGSVRTTLRPVVGVWNNYVVTFDRTSGAANVYENGVLKDFGVVTLPVLNERWVFGHNQGEGNTNGSFHGSLDEIQFYDRILSASEAVTLAAIPEPGSCALMTISLMALLAVARGAVDLPNLSPPFALSSFCASGLVFAARAAFCKAG